MIEGEERVTPTNKILAQQEEGYRRGLVFRHHRALLRNSSIRSSAVPKADLGTSYAILMV